MDEFPTDPDIPIENEPSIVTVYHEIKQGDRFQYLSKTLRGLREATFQGYDLLPDGIHARFGFMQGGKFYSTHKSLDKLVETSISAETQSKGRKISFPLKVGPLAGQKEGIWYYNGSVKNPEDKDNRIVKLFKYIEDEAGGLRKIEAASTTKELVSLNDIPPKGE